MTKTHGMVRVLTFTEGEFESVESFGSEAEARGYSDGFVAGALKYGAGKVGAYIMPNDDDEMREAESEHEVIRAFVSLADKESGPPDPEANR